MNNKVCATPTELAWLACRYIKRMGYRLREIKRDRAAGAVTVGPVRAAQKRAWKQIAAFTVVLASALALTAKWVWTQAQRDAEKATAIEMKKFDDNVRFCQTSLEVCLTRYRVTLRGAQGLFAASKDVEPEEWRSYVETVMEPAHFPSIRQVCAITSAGPAENSTVQSEHWAVTHWISRESSDGEWGGDRRPDADESDAMQRAADTDLPHASPRLICADNATADLMMYLPIYANGAPPVTVEQRRVALRGWVAMRLNVTALIEETGIAAHLRPQDYFQLSCTAAGSSESVHRLFGIAGSKAERVNSLQKMFTINTIGLPLSAQITRPIPTINPWDNVHLPLAAFGTMVSFLAGGFVATLVRSRLRAEDVAAELEDVVRARTAELDRFFTLSIDLLCIADIDGFFKRLSPAWERVFGFSIEEMLARPWIEFVHPDDRPLTLEAAVRLAQGQEVVGFENRYRCKNGTYRWLLWASAVDTSTGRIYAAAHDFTERKQAEQELDNARKSAEAANTAKSRFLAHMSHEIRTPLTALIGYAELLQDSQRSDELRSEYVNIIRRNSEHLLSVLNDILDVSKMEAGEMMIENVVCSPAEIIRDATELLRVRAQAKELDFHLEYATSVPATIRSDPTRLRQILINLIGNAVKFTDQGSVTLRVSLFGDSRPLLRFDVIDTGIGISDEARARLFRPFSQADTATSRRFGGTGLGLTICKTLVDLLGGDISAESQPGRGSTFSFTIPTGPLGGVAMLTSFGDSGQHSSEPSALPHLNGRILLAEDDLHLRLLLQTYLNAAGAEVAVAGDGRVASRMVQEADAAGRPFHVIFLDMQMPEMDGYSTVRMLRAMGCLTPVVALTAHCMAEDRTRCLEAGCNEYMTKPVRRADLINVAARYLRKHLEPGHQEEPAGDSEIPDDEVLAQFLPQYIEELHTIVVQLERSVATQDLSDLAAIVHKLKGGAAMFGLMTVAKSACTLDDLLKRVGPFCVIRSAAADLAAQIRAVRGYDVHQEEALRTAL